MNRTCRVRGCGLPAASRFAAHCTVHKARIRRHGAADQQGITKADLAPHLKRVRSRIEKNQHNPAWITLDARWSAIVDRARQIETAYFAGRPGHRDERQAAHEVAKLAADVEPRAVVETVLAVVMMLEMEPRRFRTDAAFRTQLVRRVRALTDVNFGERYHHATGRVKRVYRDLSPRAAAILGQWLVEALGGAGMHVAQLERREMEQKAQEQEAFRAALRELK
jgi:hypothetical protein